jgi:hypothetical protein
MPDPCVIFYVVLVSPFTKTPKSILVLTMINLAEVWLKVMKQLTCWAPPIKTHLIKPYWHFTLIYILLSLTMGMKLSPNIGTTITAFQPNSHLVHGVIAQKYK